MAAVGAGDTGWLRSSAPAVTRNGSVSFHSSSVLFNGKPSPTPSVAAGPGLARSPDVQPTNRPPDRPLGALRQRPEYGFEFRGKSVRLLADRSLRIDSRAAHTASFLAAYSPLRLDSAGLAACVQCGACTASCGLMDDGILVPRRQMTLLAQGQHRALIADIGIWHCRACNHCTLTCPAGAMPGQVMAAIRQMAVEHFAPGEGLARVGRSWRLTLCVAVGVALFLLLVVGLKSQSPTLDHVYYASLFSHSVLNAVFGTAALVALGVLGVGVSRAWAAFSGSPMWKADFFSLGRALLWSCGASLAGRGTVGDCGEPERRTWTHLAIVYGFGGLFVVAGAVAIQLARGGVYPLDALHPLKVVGNVCGLALIAGSAAFAWPHLRSLWRGEPPSCFHATPSVSLLLVAATGLLTEVFRYLDLPLLAYPAYFVHLIAVLTTFVILPYSKLAHAAYHTVAAVYRRYAACHDGPRVAMGDEAPVLSCQGDPTPEVS